MKMKYCVVYVIASDSKAAHYDYRVKAANQAWRLGNCNYDNKEEALETIKKLNIRLGINNF